MNGNLVLKLSPLPMTNVPRSFVFAVNQISEILLEGKEHLAEFEDHALKFASESLKK